MSSTVHSFCFLIILSSIVDEVEVVSTMVDMAAASTMVDWVAVSTMVDMVASSTMVDMAALSTMVDMAALSTNLVVNEILRPGLSTDVTGGPAARQEDHVATVEHTGGVVGKGTIFADGGSVPRSV